MNSDSDPVFTRYKLAGFLVVVAVSTAVYWQTCFQTITWWNNLEYSIAAITLGVPHPPGSLLLVLLGWIMTKLPLGITSIYSLNLLAGLLAGLTSGLVMIVAANIAQTSATSLTRQTDRLSTVILLIGITVGSLAFAFGETVWLYAIKFQPYVLTALFTAIILWAMIHWWQRADAADAIRWLFLLGLLFGLDISVHRTNALLLPGVLCWILLRDYKTLLRLKSWLYGVSGLVLGLLVHLLIIPIASRDPFLNANQPDNLSRLYDYVSLKTMGGGFLFDIFSRKADFWSVQVVDFLNAFAATFLPLEGNPGYLGILPVLLGLVGFIFLWRNSRKLTIAFAVLFFVTSITTIFYFNIPVNFFRSLHRHYLPCMVIFAVIMTYGAGALLLSAWKLRRWLRSVAVICVALLLIAVVTAQITQNFHRLDGSKNRFTYDFAANVFNSLPENAIVFVNGDNDTFPLWFLQVAEGVRPDVTVVNLPLLNTKWYVRHLLSRNPDFPLPYTMEDFPEPRVRLWQDTTIALPVDVDPDDFQLPPGTELPDTLYLHISPTVQEKAILAQDWLLLQMVVENRWRRPICFLTTVSQQLLRWLSPYLRLEGYSQRLIPLDSPPLNKEVLRENLFERYVYRGYDNPDIPLDQISRMMAFNLYHSFLSLAFAEMADGNDSACVAVKKKMLEVLPPERIEPPEGLRAAIRELCDQENSEQDN